jgi:hypothetical protein
LVTGRSGRVDFRNELVVRFTYGATVPWVSRLEDGGGIDAIGGPERLILRTTAPLCVKDASTVGDFAVKAGETVPFVLSYGSPLQGPPPPIDPFGRWRVLRLGGGDGATAVPRSGLGANPSSARLLY